MTCFASMCTSVFKDNSDVFSGQKTSKNCNYWLRQSSYRTISQGKKQRVLESRGVRQCLIVIRNPPFLPLESRTRQVSLFRLGSLSLQFNTSGTFNGVVKSIIVQVRYLKLEVYLKESILNSTTILLSHDFEESNEHSSSPVTCASLCSSFGYEAVLEKN
jgi:hypothetical protein